MVEIIYDSVIFINEKENKNINNNNNNNHNNNGNYEKKTKSGHITIDNAIHS